jgi:hypothetical protein
MGALETLALIFTAITCTAGATWVIHTAIAKVATALAVHVEEDRAVHADVIELKAMAAKKRTRR